MRIVLLCGMSVLAGCSTASFQEETSATPVVPVAAVINSLKCGLARAGAGDEYNRAGLMGSTAKVNLAVNVVQGTDVGGGASLVDAGVPVFSGGTLTGGLSFSSTTTRTINSFLNFNITLTDRSTSICRDGEIVQDGGFSAWMKSVVQGIVEARAGGPRAQVIDYDYESDFVVKKSVSGKAGFTMAPIKVSGSAGYDRSDVQHIKITIAATHKVRDPKTGKISNGDGGTIFKAPVTPLMWSHGNFGMETK